MRNLSPIRPGLLALIPAWLFLLNCSPVVAPPSIEKIFPPEAGVAPASEPAATVDFNLDGTLSMQGFARAGDGKFSQLLQDLDLSFSQLWKPGQIGYHRFGSVIENISQRPFYVAASSEGFYKATREYATTRIDNVFSKSVPGQLTIVMTDLFEQDLDISSIQQSLRSASFPEKASLAIWQWRMPFNGPIFDFDFRVHEGRNYTGDRYLYMLALGAKDSIDRLRSSIDRTVTIGKPNYLLLSGHPLKAEPNWFSVTQTANVALKSRFPGTSSAEPFTVYRVSRGCTTASITARPELPAASDGSPELASPGTYKAGMFAVAGSQGKWSTRVLGDADPAVTSDRSGHPVLKVQLSCPEVTESKIVLLRVRRVGTGADILVPSWITASSANSMAFNDALKRKERNWGEKTLNLAPLIQGLANAATERTTLAIAYIYFVAS